MNRKLIFKVVEIINSTVDCYGRTLSEILSKDRITLIDNSMVWNTEGKVAILIRGLRSKLGRLVHVYVQVYAK